MLNRWVRTWGCAVRTEHWLELDGLDFETGWVGMLLVFGSFHYMWHHVRFNSWNNPSFCLPSTNSKKMSLCNHHANSEAKFANQEPNNMSPRSHQMQWRPCQPKKGGEVWWIGNENNCVFCCEVEPTSNITNEVFGLVACFLNHLFWATRMSSQNKSRMASKFWEWHWMAIMASWRTLEQ